MDVKTVRAEVQKSRATKYLFFLSMKFTLCHPCGVLDFESAPRFVEYSCTPASGPLRHIGSSYFSVCFA